jgi:hypothetical protein
VFDIGHYSESFSCLDFTTLGWINDANCASIIARL